MDRAAYYPVVLRAAGPGLRCERTRFTPPLYAPAEMVDRAHALFDEVLTVLTRPVRCPAVDRMEAMRQTVVVLPSCHPFLSCRLPEGVTPDNYEMGPQDVPGRDENQSLSRKGVKARASVGRGPVAHQGEVARRPQLRRG